MPTPTKGARLGGSPSHERIILANLASQLFEHGRIVTTEAKAKRLRPVAEKLITKAKRGDIHARRQVLATVRDKGVVHALFTEIAPSFTEREGGYTRITKVGPRKGDNAPMAMIELVTESVEDSRKSKSRAAAPAKSAPAKKATTAAPAKAAASESEAPAEKIVEETDETLDETAEQEAPSDDTSTEEAADEDAATQESPSGEVTGEQTVEEENVPDQDSSTTKQ